ncbi:MAG: hypothetical protein ACK559_32295, partial [bacterium]
DPTRADRGTEGISYRDLGTIACGAAAATDGDVCLDQTARTVDLAAAGVAAAATDALCHYAGGVALAGLDMTRCDLPVGVRETIRREITQRPIEDRHRTTLPRCPALAADADIHIEGNLLRRG